MASLRNGRAFRRAVALADAIICVNRRDRETLATTVLKAPFARAHVIPAADRLEALLQAQEIADLSWIAYQGG